jgi:hypothetical protein
MASLTHRSRSRHVVLWPLACAAALLLAVVPAAVATVSIPGPPVVPPSTTPVTALGPLSPSNPVVSFTGPVLNSSPLPLVNSPDPVVCGPGCQEYHLVVAKPDPFLVAVKGTITGSNGSFNPNDGFDLYVYDPSGSLVGSQNGIGSNGQSVAISKPAVGTYTLVVTFSYAEDQGISYTGEARLMSGPSWQPAPCTATAVNGLIGCFELPQLQVLPPYDIAVSGLPPVASTPVGFPLPNPVPMPTSCYLDETVPIGDPTVGGIENPATRCLRFTSDVRNIGGGPLEIRIPLVSAGSSGVTAAYLPGECFAQQVVTSEAGTQATRPAGTCQFHLQHLHFHYSDLLAYSLYDVAPSGGIGSKVGSSVKASFCLSDDDYFGYGTAGPNGERDFTGQPGCNVPANSTSGAPYIDEGIQPGWGDVYTWDTPDQYIDITNTPPGTYDLIEQTNPTGALLVAGPAQTCAMTTLRLSASAVQVVSFTPSVSCPTS